MADSKTYLADVVAELRKDWPHNRTVNIVCHGHSVPAGYFKTPVVDTFNAYPHLLHVGLRERFPHSVTNVIVTAIGGEHSESGAARFDRDVLCHRPDVLTIDYGLNDRRLGLARAEKAWQSMIERAQAKGIKLILLSPTSDVTQAAGASEAERRPLPEQAAQIHKLAAEYGTGLVDSLSLFEKYVADGGKLEDLLSQSNHPNRKGHDLVAAGLLEWFAR